MRDIFLEGAVLIDWFTVFAQAVNFLILVALLKRFLYGRILNAMDAREREIASRLEEAERRKDEAEREAAAYREKAEELEKKREALLQEAREEAEKARRRLVDSARDETDRLRERWRDTVRQEKERFLAALRKRTTEELYRVARRTLRDLADADLEDRIVEAGLKRLRNLDEERKREIAAGPAGEARAVTVRSAFEVPEAKRRALHDVLAEHFGPDSAVTYHTDPGLMGGIEILAGGFRIAWTIKDYLDDLEAAAQEMLSEEAA